MQTLNNIDALLLIKLQNSKYSIVNSILASYYSRKKYCLSKSAFLRVHKHEMAPKLSVLGDMGWEPYEVRQKGDLLRLWNSFINMLEDRYSCIISMNECDIVFDSYYIFVL